MTLDLRPTIVPKSDQMNADDLIGQTITIKVSKVALLADKDQPIAIHYEGDLGKPYKPGKSMRRVMVMLWGEDGHKFVGRRMTLFRDEMVQFGGHKVGGIRISHMSHIGEKEVTLALRNSRGNIRPYTVKPLGGDEEAGKATLADRVVAFKEAVQAAPTVEEKKALRKRATQLFKAIDADTSGDIVTTSVALDKWFEERVAELAAKPSPKLAKNDKIIPTETVTADAKPEPQESQQGSEKYTGHTIYGEAIELGHAAKDEVYLHADFPAMENGDRVAFQNGERFTTMGPDPQKGLTVYAEHVPEVPAEPETTDTTSTATTAEVEDEDEGGMDPELAAYVDTVENATTWVDVKKAMASFYQTPYFANLKDPMKNHIRGTTWDVVQAANYPDKPDHAVDVSAFRLWIEWIEDADAIHGTLRVLEADPAFAQKDDNFKAAIRTAAEVRVRALQVTQG